MSIPKILKRWQIILIIFAILGCISSVWAQSNEVQVKLLRDADSITIFIPAVQGSVSLKGFSVESPDLSQGLSAVRGVRLDQASGFAGLDFDSLPTPICLRLLRVSAQIPVPIDCKPGLVTIFVVGLSDGDIFWQDSNAGPLNIIIRIDDDDGNISNDRRIATCPARTPLCNFTIPVKIGATPTPLPEMVLDRIAVQAVEYFKAERFADAANEATQYIQLQSDDAFGYLLRALAKVYLKSYDEALSDYDKALQIDSKLKYHAYLGRGNVYLDLNNPQAAVDDFTHAIEIQPDSAIPYYLRARAYEALNQYDVAIKDFQSARDKGMNSAIVLVELGRMYFEQGDLNNALVSFDAAVANNNNMAAAYSGRSAVQYALGHTQEAIDDATRALQPSPTPIPSGTVAPSFDITVDNVINVFTVALSIDNGIDTTGTYCNRGRMYMDNKDYTAAITDFENARNQNSKSLCAFTGLALTYSYTNNQEQVTENVSAALFLQPTDAATYNNLGVAYMNVDKFEDAVPIFSQAIQHDSSVYAYYTNRATAYLNLDQYQMSIDDYEQAIKLKDGRDSTFHNLGVAYEKLDNNPKAIENFSSAINLNNTEPKYYFDRGNVYLKTGEYGLAIGDYNKSLTLNFNDMRVYFNLGVAYFNQSDYATAAENFKQAIAIGMDTGDVYYNLGLSYYNLNQFADAVSNFQTAVKRDTSNAQFHYLLADSLLRINPKDCNALPSLNEYLRLAGTQARPEAQQALSQLQPICGG